MIRKPFFQIFVATIVAICAGVFISRNTPRVYASTGPVAFTAEYVVTTHNVSNVELQNATTVFAQRSDGSSVILQKTVGQGFPNGLRRVLNTKIGQMVTVDPATSSLTTYTYTDRDLEFYRRPPSGCEQQTRFAPDPAAQEKVFGFEVKRFSGTIPGSEHTSERWMAPDLNCFVLREETTILPERSKFSRVTKSVNLGEPDPALFEIPVSGYTERSPSEVLTIARRNLGLAPTPKSSHTFTALDKIYVRQNSK